MRSTASSPCVRCMPRWSKGARPRRGRAGAELARTIDIYDTTLRDGCQAEDISLTLEDKLRITERLDDFGIAYVEGGWPGSNPRDEAYFDAVRQLKLQRIKVAAFGSTRRANVRA